MFVAGMIRHGVRDPGNDPNLNFNKKYTSSNKELTDIG